MGDDSAPRTMSTLSPSGLWLRFLVLSQAFSHHGLSDECRGLFRHALDVSVKFDNPSDSTWAHACVRGWVSACMRQRAHSNSSRH